MINSPFNYDFILYTNNTIIIDQLFCSTFFMFYLKLMNLVISPADMHVRKYLNIFVIVSNAVSVNLSYLAENKKKIQKV